MSEESVKVAVRVRPFNQREKDANAKLCVSMTGNQTICTDPKSNEEKKFAYDFSYWSYDGFKADASGYFQPDSPKYADQKKVYNDLGAGVLTNAWNGYNASLFAYGQTGSGKSYSVVGYGPNKGIVPLVCEDIFKKAPTIKDKTIEVTFSMLEIYSEACRDLLSLSADRKQGLIIREDPKIGFYPTGLTKKLVATYDDIVKLTDQGTANRTIASTNMNATSSRAHTIVTVNLVQKYKNEAGKEMALSSLINLVDLAGSERADATGATGDRLKEGAAINLSLTSLGNVISALADNSAGKNVRVPYRDSVLTKLLMNALGGNSKTIMIAAISPAEINFDETVSTLRYADRAKQIKCKAVVNEDPTEKLIKDLKEENAKLKKMLESGKIDPSLLAQIKTDGTPAASDEAMKKILEENEKAMKLMQQSYEEKLADSKKNQDTSERSVILEKAKKIAHLTNINMDPSLSKTIKLLLEGNGNKVIGLPGKSDIGLAGLGIQDPHGTITVQGDKFTIESNNNSKLLRNGLQIKVPTELNHLDRLLFGSSQYYLFINPSKATLKDQDYNFEAMQDEIAKASGIARTATQNWSPNEIKAQQEFLDLLPLVNEVNEISMEMDRKIEYSVISVPPDICGVYDEKPRAFVAVKNFHLGLEWMWERQKFIERKSQISEYYLDFKDDGIINSDKFKNFDPFFESPTTPTQIGTAILSLKPAIFLMQNKTEINILDLRSRQAGTLSIELLPCDENGNPLNEKSLKIVRNPNEELINKNICFMLKINSANISHKLYENISAQFQMYSDSLNEQPTKKSPLKATVAEPNAGLGARPQNDKKSGHHPNGPPDQKGQHPNGPPPQNGHHPNGPPPPNGQHPNGPPPPNAQHPNGPPPPNAQHPNGPPPPNGQHPNGPPPPNGLPPAPPPNSSIPPANGQISQSKEENKSQEPPVKAKIKMIDFKTEVIKGTSTPAFKFSQVFYYTVNKELVDFFQKKSIFIKIYGEQKNPHPNENVSSLSTKEYFEKRMQDASNSISGKMPSKLIDPRVEELQAELKFYKTRYNMILNTVGNIEGFFMNYDVNDLINPLTKVSGNKHSSTCTIL